MRQQLWRFAPIKLPPVCGPQAGTQHCPGVNPSPLPLQTMKSKHKQQHPTLQSTWHNKAIWPCANTNMAVLSSSWPSTDEGATGNQTTKPQWKAR